MSNNALFTIEQVDNKLIITVEAVKAETVKPEQVDLSNFNPFPEGYNVPEGTKVVSLIDYCNVKKGEIGYKMKQDYYYRFESDEHVPSVMNNDEVAPLDPSDHPDYKPEQIGIDEKDVAFHCDERKTDTSEMRPMNAEEISDWAKNVSNLSILEKNLLHRYINDAIQYELNKAKR